jgi:CO/xanthine dehydrogenase Mo-binding subunit
MPELKIVGKPVQKHDAIAKVCGKLVYADDYSLPGMLYGKALRSKYPAARIVSIDTGKAEKHPGIKAVLTARDVPNNNTLTKFGQTRDVGGGFESLYRVLAENKVRFMGEAVALVAAESKELAEEALDLIDVQYEPLPGVFDPLEALKPDAYLVGEETSNLISRFQIKKGDIEAGFREADLILENTYRVPFVDHAYIEPESGVAWLDENNVITIRVCTQVVEHFRGVAKALNIPQNRIRIIGTMNGGGFGGKEDITVETFLALLVMKTGKPVKMTYSREESFIAHSKRHPYVMEYKAGARKDGRLVALKARLVSDGGAYPYLSPWVLLYSTVNAAGPYNIANVHVETMSA